MATRRQQVGGMQEVFVEAKGRGVARIFNSCPATRMGGQVHAGNRWQSFLYGCGPSVG